MELGNLIFGCSRGEFETPGEFDTLLLYLTIRINNKEIHYGINYETDIFKMQPYCWKDCDCGYEQLVMQWEKDNKHSETCYQTLVKNYLIKKGYPEDVYAIGVYNKNLVESYRKDETEIRNKLCKDFGLSHPGDCTCNYEIKLKEFYENENHKSSCCLVQPNFWYKPTDFKIMWYKYIGRDSYMNQNINVDDFVTIIDKCVESLKKG